MSSENKKKKLKNSHFVPSWLKNKKTKLKRCGFYNASQRQAEKKLAKEDIHE